MTYRCHHWGERSKSWAAAQRHADAHRHPRIECILEPVRKRTVQ